MSKAETSKATGRLWRWQRRESQHVLYIERDGKPPVTALVCDTMSPRAGNLRDMRVEIQNEIADRLNGWEALEAERDRLKGDALRLAEKCDRLAEALRRIVNDLQAWESVGGSRSGHWPAMRLKAARAALDGRGA